MQSEFLGTVFDWISKQQVTLLLFLNDWYCRKLGLTDLPGQNGKVMSGKKTTFTYHQKYKGENRNYFSHFFAIFEATSKFLIVFVWLILGKKFDFKVTWKVLGFK